MRRLYATRVDTRDPSCWLVGFRLQMKLMLGDPIWAVEDPTDHNKIIFTTFCSATSYEEFRRFKKPYASDWVDFDYFNLNKIEE